MFPCLPIKKKKTVRIQSLKCQLWSPLVYYGKLFLLVSQTKLLTISSTLPRFHPSFQIYKNKTSQGQKFLQVIQRNNFPTIAH